MSLSPTARASAGRAGYESGWVAIHRLLREGLSWSGRERHCAFLNLRDGRFATVSSLAGLDLADDGRAAVVVDWDLDGAPDLVTTSRNGPRLRILRNRGLSGARWLVLRPEGRTANRDAVGARVEVCLTDGALQADTVRAGEGYLAQSSRWLHFGLGSAGSPASVLVRWPGGEAESFGGIEGAGRFVLVQGEGRARTWEGPEPARLDESASPAWQPTERARVALAARPRLPTLTYLDSDGAERTLHQPGGPPVLVLLWAEWCEPCVVELRALSRGSERVAATGLRVLALDADAQPSDTQRADSLLDRLGWPFEGGRAPPALLDTLDALQRSLTDRERPLPLPTSFLIAPDGRLAYVYKGPLDVDRLQADVEGLAGTPEEIRAAAVPFPGRWQADPPRPDLARLQAYMTERGLEQPARFYQLLQYERRQTPAAEIQLEFGHERARAGLLEQALEHYRAAIELDGELTLAWTSLGTALHGLGRLEEAVAAYEEALRLDDRDGPTRFNLALARSAAGDSAGALRELRRLRLVDGELARELAGRLEAPPDDPR